jgi:hypothetical protein
MIKNPIPGPEPLNYDELHELQELVESMPSPGDPAPFPGEGPVIKLAFRLHGKRLSLLEHKQHADEIRIKTLAHLVKWGLCLIGTIATAALLAGLWL